MVDGLEYKEIIDDGLLVFTFMSKSSTITLSITEFNGINDYNQYTEDKSECIFDDIVGAEDLIVGIDWEFNIKQSLNLTEIFLYINSIVSSYALDNKPSIIFYEAMNPKLHRVYQRMFSFKGYSLKKVLGKSYIYMRDCKDNTRLREKHEI